MPSPMLIDKVNTFMLSGEALRGLSLPSGNDNMTNANIGSSSSPSAKLTIGTHTNNANNNANNLDFITTFRYLFHQQRKIFYKYKYFHFSIVANKIFHITYIAENQLYNVYLSYRIVVKM